MFTYLSTCYLGIFRYLQRSASIQTDSEQDNLKSTVLTSVGPAAAAAAVSTLCMAPGSRPAVVSLLSTTAASRLFDNFLDNNPDLSYLRPLELLTFMAAGGWIFSSGFFYPESYEPSHMRQILKSVVLKQHVANELQEKYRQGFNPNPCPIRHKDLHCGQFARGDFFLRVVETALRLYTPVHLTAWILALRHAKMRSKPASDQLKGFATKLARSSTYSIGGAIPSLAILAESPERRRSIGLILVSYALVSAGNVATRKISWLHPGKSSVRGVLEAGCVAAAVSVIIPGFLESNHLVQRMLLGDEEIAKDTETFTKMREDQASFLEQQREVIIHQVLQSIQQSGLLGAQTNSYPKKKPSKREEPSSPTYRLEQNLHNLVHHSLAESGLDYPHVRSTAHEPKVQSEDNSNKLTADRSKKKQIIISRREVEDNGDNSQPGSIERQETNTEDQQSQKVPSQAVHPTEEIYIRKKRGSEAKRRRHRQHSRSRLQMDLIEDDYSEFVAPVDAAFAAIRKKVDLRTLAILDRSKTLLGHVRQQPSTDKKTSFVEKLRQRHAIANTGNDNRETCSTDETPKPADNDNQPIEQNSEEESVDQVEESETSRISPDDIRCDLELLKPPSKAPDNDNEWENELARQILTIYATSVKAKALEKANVDKTQTDNQSPCKTSAGEKQRLQSAGKSMRPNVRGGTLKTSCSLPAIGKKTSKNRTSTSSATIHYSWEPSQLRENGKVILNMPKVPRPIWFAGTGAVKAVWCALADGFSQFNRDKTTGSVSLCDHRLCEEVRQLEAKKKFVQCISTLESLLVALVRSRGVDELETKLWKQLVVTCNAFASRCIDYHKFPVGLKLMKQAEHLIDNSILVDNITRMELLAYLYDTYAHYYYKRRKPDAGLQYITKAHEIHSRQSSWSHLAKCRLHIANLLSFQKKHVEAMRYMASILEMIEENKLQENSEGVGEASAQKLCLAAVCYNNLAVEQLHMREFEAANISSSNAQRLAKLCLSYSNRWLSQFQATSDCIALAIATLMEDMNVTSNLLGNRRVLIDLLLRRQTLSSLRLTKPSRNVAALAVFIGVFRFLQRSAKRRKSRDDDSKSSKAQPQIPGAVLAGAVASGLGVACLTPRNRPALVSLLSTNAASQLIQELQIKHPDLLLLKPLELLAFMTAVGWIYYSGFFHPESYHRSHMRLILKYVLLTQPMASELQDKYRLGLNPNPCSIRHTGLSCAQFARSDFLRRVTSEAFRLYFPVHFSAWCFSQRHAKVRSKPLSTRLRRFVAKLFRSTAYFTTFVYVGWMLSCQMGNFGDRSITHRKWQFFLGGALPSLAIFIESPSRRRPIGLILSSYVLLSMGNVAFRRVPWLQPGASPVRGLIEAGCVATAVSATISCSLKNNHLVRRILLGDVEARALQHRMKEAEAKTELAET
ncbi:hypothetical protein P3T76_000964 [Phytophthora citrophthora]|uniref:Transmembrane protein 135 N-terminal domain-containing protein n=1 Tax=Phytophthora citrophthora TaxID=4793 RepID=A0AAD9GYH4_9STRA|nr:hypothetical protein P3T76_000964 [Phytophthora citrophthora]